MKLFKANRKPGKRHLGDLVTILGIVFGVLALLALVYYQVRPVKTVDIKVPVATDKASYYPGQEISGLFFGEVFYSGRVEIIREVFCKDYRAIIKTDDGSETFRGISKPTKLEGDSRKIGYLPKEIPIGSNCVLQFINTYHISTPFGERRVNYDYYTQNFSIITEGRRKQLDCEADGGTDCNKFNQQDGQPGVAPSPNPPTSFNNDLPLFEEAPSASQTFNGAQVQPQQVQQNIATAPAMQPSEVPAPTPTPAPQPTPAPSEPIQPPRVCTINLLGICIKL